MSSGSCCAHSRTDGWRVQGSDEWLLESLLGVTEAATSSDEKMVVITPSTSVKRHGASFQTRSCRKGAMKLAARLRLPGRRLALFLSGALPSYIGMQQVCKPILQTSPKRPKVRFPPSLSCVFRCRSSVHVRRYEMPLVYGGFKVKTPRTSIRRYQIGDLYGLGRHAARDHLARRVQQYGETMVSGIREVIESSAAAAAARERIRQAQQQLEAAEAAQDLAMKRVGRGTRGALGGSLALGRHSGQCVGSVEPAGLDGEVWHGHGSDLRRSVAYRY